MRRLKVVSSDLGPARDPVRLVPYDPEWPRTFARFERRLRSLMPTARIEHVGSTSVPGMESKPVIDLSVGLSAGTRLRTEAARAIGLEFRSVSPESTHFVFRDDKGRHVAHVHVNPLGSEPELKLLRFRDFLRAHGVVARGYLEMKHSILANPRARGGYAEAKDPFIRGLNARIKRWARRVHWAPGRPPRS